MLEGLASSLFQQQAIWFSLQNYLQRFSLIITIPEVIELGVKINLVRRVAIRPIEILELTAILSALDEVQRILK